MKTLKLKRNNHFRYVDLFAGIGGFRYAIEGAAFELGVTSECVFTSEIDRECQKVYFENFRDEPFGDITKINENEIPDHDILLAGFPCQPLSQSQR